MSIAQNPSFVWDFEFLNPVYLYGNRKLVCLWFSSFSWKGAPSTKENCICGRVNSVVSSLSLHAYKWSTVTNCLFSCEICVSCFMRGVLYLLGSMWVVSLRMLGVFTSSCSKWICIKRSTSLFVINTYKPSPVWCSYTMCWGGSISNRPRPSCHGH